MIPTAYVNLYSGMKNPEKELSNEEATTIRDLVSKLDKSYPGQVWSQFGFTGYSAFLDENMYVIANIHGYVQIFDMSGTAKIWYDTTGVYGYLAQLMAPVVVRHYEDAAATQWIDPTWIYQPPPWEPQF